MIGPAAGGRGATAPLFNARTRRRGRDVSTEKDGNLCLSLSMFGGVKQIIERIKLMWGKEIFKNFYEIEITRKKKRDLTQINIGDPKGSGL